MTGAHEGVVQALPWRRAALPLLLSSRAAGQESGPHPLDRIRIQKAVFLLVQRGAPAWRDVYEYHPYNWGPYCRDLTDDLAALVQAGILRISHADRASTYGRYVATDLGEQVAARLWETLGRPEAEFIQHVFSYVTHKDFNGLLREVYDAYPDFARQSIWAGKR